MVLKCPHCKKIVEAKETNQNENGMLETNCSECGKKFELNETTMIKEEAKTKLKCPACRKVFEEGKDLTVSAETGRMETTCPYCNQRFEITKKDVIE